MTDWQDVDYNEGPDRPVCRMSCGAIVCSHPDPLPILLDEPPPQRVRTRMWRPPTMESGDRIRTATLMRELMLSLADYHPFIAAMSADKISCYIGFRSLPNDLTHKLRISNHPERERYGYKWQLRYDGVPTEAERKPHSRYFDNAEDLIEAFRSYYMQVKINHAARTR